MRENNEDMVSFFNAFDEDGSKVLPACPSLFPLAAIVECKIMIYVRMLSSSLRVRISQRH